MKNSMVMLPTDIRRLLKAVFNQAVKDYVKIVAEDKDSIVGIGSRKEIEKYLDTGMASAGSNIYTPDVKKKLRSMTQYEAKMYIKAMKTNKSTYANKEEQ